MKVKELIKVLQKCRQNSEVTICVDYTIEDENGNNPRAPVEGVNEEMFYDSQGDDDWHEAVLYLGKVRGKYNVDKIIMEDLKLNDVLALETPVNRIINRTSNKIEFVNGDCYAVNFSDELYHKVKCSIL